MNNPMRGRVMPVERWRYRRSLASRVILLTTMTVGIAVAFVAVGAFVTVRMQLQSSLDDSLLNRAERAAESPLLPQITADYKLPSWALGAADVRIGFITPERSYTADTGPPLQLSRPELDVAAGRSESSIRTIAAGGTNYRVVAVPAETEGQALVIAQSLEPQEQVLSRLGFVMIVFGLLGVVAAGVAGGFVARNGLRPVRSLTTAVEDMARTEDLTPLPVEGDDEVARLAGAFNQMLTALSASRDRQRQLVADAGHELRTPLTSLRTNVELLMQADEATDELPPQARAELLDDIHAQIEELTTLIGDLTELARDEPLAPVVERVDLGEVVEHAVARVRRRAGQLTLDVETEPWWVVGEATALERAVLNLLDNAAKWSPGGGVVTCRLSAGTLTVDDQGPGIADADCERVFDRFWRADESRSMPGSGLGLSIVRQAVERHSGSVEAGRSPSGGARLTMRLPGTPADSPASAAPASGQRVGASGA
ncbi:MAG: HAMP domain-containing sensor histidine kinase [Nocardioides sp.]